MVDGYREALEWIVCIPWIGGRVPPRCPVCQIEILTPDDIKQCKFGRSPAIVHKTCWEEYENRMPDMTTTEAAVYLAERGYTVHSKRDDTDTAPNATTIKQWCLRGKIKARKSGWVWLVGKRELDKLIEERKKQVSSQGIEP